jgi:hypothetical protein
MRFEQGIEGGAGNSGNGPDLEGLATHASETVGGVLCQSAVCGVQRHISASSSDCEA